MRKLAILLALLAGVPSLAQNYQATQGSGTTFGSKLVSAVNYPQILFCDPSTPSQCVGVNSSGQITVLQGGSWTVTANAGTGIATSANQATEITSLGTIATNSGTQATAANQKIINTWAGGTLGSMANYGTSPGAVLVPGVNSFITNIPHVVCDSGCSGSGGTSATDEAAFTYGTSTYTPSGGVYNASITNLTSGQGGAVALTAARAFTIDALSGSNLATLLSAGTANFGAAYPSSGIAPGGKAQSSEPAAATTGNLTASFFDLTGKQVTSPYANRENMVRGSASSTDTSAHTLIAAGGAGIKTYITAIQCGRTDAGTSAIAVTFSNVAADVMVIPNNGGGGGNNQTFPVPLATAANTAFTFTSGTSTSTVYCSAQGFSGY